MGWLRTTLAQRHVDHHRHTRREEPLDDLDAPAAEVERAPAAAERKALECAVGDALSECDAELRYVLAAYYLDERTLAEIGRVLGVHEATVSRKLHRATADMRKQVLKHLEKQGLSRRAAKELLSTDPRDLQVNLKNRLQQSQASTFQEEPGFHEKAGFPEKAG